MLTIACVLVRGHVGFTPEYVERLNMMCRRRIDRPFRFVCLTDQPGDMPAGVEPIEIKLPAGCKGWWAKVQLFKPGIFDAGRVLYLDLDVLLVAGLDEIIDYPAPLALCADAGTFVPKNGLEVVKRFNSSVMVWDAGQHRHLFERWDPSVVRRLWGDQDWIGEQCPNGAAMPVAWFPRISEVRPPWPADAKVVLVKKPKPHVAVEQWGWFDEAWG